MSSDDDDTGHVHHKLATVLSKPLPSVKVWHLLVIALAAFALGAWLF